MINFLARAASTLEITNGEQQALRKFSAGWNLSLLKRCFAPSNLVDTFKKGQQAHDKAPGISPCRGSTIPSSLQPIMPCFNMQLAAKLLHLAHDSQLAVEAKRHLLSKNLFTSK